MCSAGWLTALHFHALALGMWAHTLTLLHASPTSSQAPWACTAALWQCWTLRRSTHPSTEPTTCAPPRWCTPRMSGGWQPIKSQSRPRVGVVGCAARQWQTMGVQCQRDGADKRKTVPERTQNPARLPRCPPALHIHPATDQSLVHLHAGDAFVKPSVRPGVLPGILTALVSARG